MSVPVLEARGLGKHFARRLASAPKTAKQWIMRGWRQRRTEEPFWALRDLSLTVSPGEMVGIVGHNGAGKSTLLRMLGGVMKPDEGGVTVNGRLSGLLTLNTGMHEDLSGRENILINGVIAGLTRKEVREREQAMIAFAELEDFIDNPVRTYSSGMKLRLGFAVAAYVEPDILLIDEVLSVGDIAFQQKCLDRIERFREDGMAIVLVSHDLDQVEKLCSRVIWIERGAVIDAGSPARIMPEYRNAMMNATLRRMAKSSRTLRDDASEGEPGWRIGTGEVTFREVQLLGLDGKPVETIATGDGFMVQMQLSSSEPGIAAIAQVAMTDEAGEERFDINTEDEKTGLPPLYGSSTITVRFERIDLSPGEYPISVGLYAPDWAHAYDYIWQACRLTIDGPRTVRGAIDPPRNWHVETAPLK